MMTETGTVASIDKKGRATVRFERKEACEHCRACLKPKNRPYAEIVVKNTLDAKVGDNVSVAMGERAVLTASFIAYMIPIIIVGIALLSTYKLGTYLSFGIALIALVVSELIVILIDKIIRKRTDYAPKMVAIILEKGEKEDE